MGRRPDASAPANASAADATDGGRYEVPSESIVRNVLVRVDPAQLDRALQRWNDAHGAADEVLAIDGKTMCNAIYTDARTRTAANGDAKPTS